jgi:mannose/fructose-specific phosphotransferase system component IIA
MSSSCADVNNPDGDTCVAISSIVMVGKRILVITSVNMTRLLSLVSNRFWRFNSHEPHRDTARNRSTSSILNLLLSNIACKRSRGNVSQPIY